MRMPALQGRRWTAADVRGLMDESRHWPRYELLHGELLVTPAPEPAHQLAVGELYAALREYCGREQVGVALMSPADIELVPEAIIQPDVFVVPDAAFPVDRGLRWPDIHALMLAVEVLSPSTMRRDRVNKRDFYLANGVDQYWVVDLDARVVERWTQDAATPDIRRDRLEWHPRGARAPFVLDVPVFFASNRGLPKRV